MTVWFWFWIALAAVLLASEALSGGFYILPFGAGALCAGLLEYLKADVSWQWLAFVAVSSVSMVVLRRTLGRRAPAGPSPAGEEAVVVERLDAMEGRGRVLVGDREWRGYAPGWEPVPEGTLVTVERVGRGHLIVRPAGTDRGAVVTAEQARSAASE